MMKWLGLNLLMALFLSPREEVSVDVPPPMPPVEKNPDALHAFAPKPVEAKWKQEWRQKKIDAEFRSLTDIAAEEYYLFESNLAKLNAHIGTYSDIEQEGRAAAMGKGFNLYGAARANLERVAELIDRMGKIEYVGHERVGEVRKKYFTETPSAENLETAKTSLLKVTGLNQENVFGKYTAKLTIGAELNEVSPIAISKG